MLMLVVQRPDVENPWTVTSAWNTFVALRFFLTLTPTYSLDLSLVGPPGGPSLTPQIGLFAFVCFVSLACC